VTSPATPTPYCPWCNAYLPGEVIAVWRDGELRSFVQTRRIGSSDYTWIHNKDGCFVPQLQRIAPSKVARNFEAMKRREVVT
jgi:hypothetical protein